MAGREKPEASLFRCDGLDSARKVLIARSATKYQTHLEKATRSPKERGRTETHPIASTSREKREGRKKA